MPPQKKVKKKFFGKVGLTAREMARLQSFPDDFIFEGNKSKQLVQIGNAVPCLLGKAIGLAIRYGNNDLINCNNE